MNKESVIISTFKIERQRQVKLFQIKIPKEVKNIIGIEMGLRFIEGKPVTVQNPNPWVLPMTIKNNHVLGDLKLQSYDAANVFYSGELALDNNISYGDFSSQFFKPENYSHQQQSNEEVISVSGKSTIIQGVYRDKLADQQAGNYKYAVSVYIWCEIKEEQTV